MSKKVNTNNTEKVATNATINNSVDTQTLFEKYSNVSLRRLALATETTYTLLLKASKTPIEGVPYSADAINYDAVAQFFNRRHIELSALDWEALNQISVNRKDGKVIKDMDQWNVGDKVYLRKSPTVPYDIIYKTETHIVIMLEGSTEPQAWIHNTFLLNGPQRDPRAVTEQSTQQVEDTEETQEVEGA